MANLFSHHDKLHVHAILGLTSLLHFLYRFFLLFAYRYDSFTRGYASAALLGVHFFLHATSFQFDLPRKRLWTKPMIWREFRIHNAIFAYRHLVGALLGIWFPEWWWRNPTIDSMMVKVMLVLGACWAAERATLRVGSEEKRTTNAMPYPSRTSENMEQTAKWFYAKSQFAATALAAFGTPALTFGSVLAIEIASFLMTLVRKGIIDSHQYHIVYAASLFIMFPAVAVTLHSPDEGATLATFRALCATFISCELRMNYNQSKYLTWFAALVGGALAAAAISSVMDVKLPAWMGMTWSAGDTVIIFLKARRNERLYGSRPDAGGVPDAPGVTAREAPEAALAEAAVATKAD